MLKIIRINMINKTYKKIENLVIHQEKIHNIIIEVIDENIDNRCSICNNCYCSKSKLKRHIDTIHNKNEDCVYFTLQ